MKEQQTELVPNPDPDGEEEEWTQEDEDRSLRAALLQEPKVRSSHGDKYEKIKLNK